ncbi:MarR family winged helix-turn-helix transcriptional regulator [Methanolobus bombayensis]|uniref:MarR family winged helix-turn-helix transcriptional regulator n=1 Tax=Methanolobus bombayensis TaxID=38023 RepID=UPI001AE692A1|nr:MarR family transcriptional regulator [Methanolobus bombayensis]MBP1909872.1 DNA-binding MarR family transcriptional regulator [Methanolobus bombayensis]
MDTVPVGAFIAIAYRSGFVRLNQKMKELGLSAGQFYVLLILSHEQGLTQDTLSRQLLIDQASIARAVNVLVNKGFVKRITDETDRRAVRIYFTEEGEELIPKISQIDEEMEEDSLSGLTIKERKEARDLLRKISQNIYEKAYEKDDKKRTAFPLKDHWNIRGKN